MRLVLSRGERGGLLLGYSCFVLLYCIVSRCSGILQDILVSGCLGILESGFTGINRVLLNTCNRTGWNIILTCIFALGCFGIIPSIGHVIVCWIYAVERHCYVRPLFADERSRRQHIDQVECILAESFKPYPIDLFTRTMNSGVSDESRPLRLELLLWDMSTCVQSTAVWICAKRWTHSS